jgi:molecular chaperone DnaK (HSP70)
MCGSITVSREEFTHLLERHNLPGITNRTIDRALAAAQLKEDNGDTVSLVLMIGQANRIPGFLEIVRTRFSPGRVLCEKPEHVVARGAARLGPGCVSRPRITRDYALRYYDPKACGHQYRYIVRAGTEYPTERETARVLISAAYDGQTRLGIALYSLSGNGHEPVQQGIELVADPQGATRRHERPAASQGMDAVRINRLSPTFLVATPPGNCGQVRFELAFSIDRTGQLRLSARDVMTGRHILENHSCAQLT